MTDIIWGFDKKYLIELRDITIAGVIVIAVGTIIATYDTELVTAANWTFNILFTHGAL